VFSLRERNSIRVAHWGLGEVGLAMAQLVWRRPGLISVGAICSDPARAGRDLGELIGFGEYLGINVNSDPMGVLTEARPDVTLIATGSSVDEVGPQILQAMEAGSNVICLAEEMTYPWATRPDLADSLDELAHAHGVTVLGTGLNPGFVLDTLAVALTGCCWDVERIKASRVIDVSDWEDDVRASLGVGLSPSHFAEGLRQGRITGHVGFEQSIHLIADALGWKLDRVEQERRPIIAEVRRGTARGDRVEPGRVAGTHDAAIGYVDGLARIVLEHPQQVAPTVEGIMTGDFIDIEGVPNIRLSIQPEINALKGTAGIAVNMIPAVLMAGPGLKTMAELPLPRAVLGDLREMIDVQGPTVEEELSRGWHIARLGGHDPQGQDQTGIESP
jgi:2,4-diaminopentanoate dehydrogenase